MAGVAGQPKEKIKLSELPVLEGWRSLVGASRYLGVTRARVYQMVEEGKITSCRRVEDSTHYLVRDAELKEIKDKWLVEARERAQALAR
jgi:excisionase family DNA binding protein